MSNITNYLNKVKTAIYGKEVRGAIHDAIKQVYDDASVEHDNANMEVKLARGTHNTLNDRLDNVDEIQAQTNAQLFKKANSSEVVKKGYASLNDFDEDVRSLLLGLADAETNINAVLGHNNVVNYNLAPKSVDIENTTFGIRGKNKFNGRYLAGYSITGSQDSGFKLVKSSNQLARTCIIEIEANTEYTISKDASDRFRICTASEYPVNGSSLNQVGSGIYDSNDYKTFTSQPDDRFLVIYVSTDGVEPMLQVECGSVATSKTYGIKIPTLEFEENSIPVEAIGINNGDLSISTIFNATNYGISVGSETSIIVDLEQNKIKISDVGCYIYAGTRNLPCQTKQELVCDTSTNGNLLIFNTTNKEFELINVSSDTLLEKITRTTLVVGAVRHLNGSITYYQINGVHKVIDKPQSTREKVKFDLAWRFKPYYSNANYIALSNNINDVYSIYDELVAKYPDYVSKTLLCTNTSGMPIYRYDFKPKKIKATVDYIYPKILHINCTHGHEKQACFGAVTFFKSLCEDWKENDELKMLRFNIHFVVIPILNPYGFVNNTRKNDNGVDLNRNYPSAWEEGGSSDPTATTYRGVAPLSESETLAIQSLIDNEENVIFLCDHHNPDYESWLGSINEDVNYICIALSRLFEAQNVIDEVPTDRYRVLVQSNGKATTAYHANKSGIYSAIIESSIDLGISNTHTQRHTASILANMYLMIVDKYNEFKAI